MGLKNKLLYSLVVSAAFLVGSIFVPLVPCRVAPAVPNPFYKWTLCSLNPDVLVSLSSIKEYWGYTANLTNAYLLTVIIIFIISLVVLHYATRGKDKRG